MELYNIVIFVVLFLTTFCTSFWKRVHNSKDIVNIQGLFVLTVGYLDMITYLLKNYYYIIERVYFTIRLFLLFISIYYFILAIFITVSRRHKRHYLHGSKDILFYVMFYIIITRPYLRYKKVSICTCSPFPPPSRLFVATPLIRKDFLELGRCEQLSGKVVATEIIRVLEKSNLSIIDIKNCCRQGFSGASNM